MPFITGAGIATLFQHGAQIAVAGFMVGAAYLTITNDIDALKQNVNDVKKTIGENNGDRDRLKEKLHKLDKDVTEVRGDVKRIIERQEDFQERTDKNMERLLNALANPYHNRKENGGGR